jgi:nucleotide-binding universal stress UspA family protein
MKTFFFERIGSSGYNEIKTQSFRVLPEAAEISAPATTPKEEIMTMRILVPVDGSASSRAAVRFLAGRETMLGQNPEIELLTVQNVVPQRLVEMLSLESLESYYRTEGERVFESLRGEIRAAGFQAKEVVRGGEPGKVIAKEAEDLDADLIVMGSRGQSLWKSLFLGSVSNAVLAESKRPLLLLRDEVPKTGDRLRVGIAVDGSAYGEAATDYVLAHKDFFGADPDFRVLHVVRDYQTLVATTSVEYVMPTVTTEEFEKSTAEEFEKTVEPVLKRFEQADVPVQAEKLTGFASDAIAEYAKSELDILVIGSHGYGNFKSAVLGSTAMHIAAECKVPLLVVRH